MTSLQKAAPYTNMQANINEEGRAEARPYKIEMRRETALLGQRRGDCALRDYN
jgi:hypothetical protein